jgi:hypothetical protein
MATKSPANRTSPPSGKRAPPSLKEGSSSNFVLGGDRFAKISAVEGIKLTPAMKKRAKEFDARGLSSEERRKEILKLYRKKARS